MDQFYEIDLNYIENPMYFLKNDQHYLKVGVIYCIYKII